MNRIIAKYLLYYPVTALRGERVGKYLAEYEKLQWRTKNEMEEYQSLKLNELIHYAYINVPYYREKMKSLGASPDDIKDIASLNKMPYLTKADLMQHAAILRAKAVWFFSEKTTGGSTGQAVTVLKNMKALARERAATWRGYQWAGIGIGDPQARFWGVPIRNKRRWMSKAVDIVANRRRLSAFDISTQSMERYYREIIRFRPAYFYGYVSVITEFAQFVVKKGYRVPDSVKCIITTSEVLDNRSRKIIEDAFGCRVFNEYGCGEVGSIAHECEHGRMHLMADNLVVEIDGGNGGENGTGEIVVTDLHNYAMPLIRYRLGDYATVSREFCPCGRSLPVIKQIHGRAYDMIVDPDGNRYHPEIIMYIFEELKDMGLGLKQFQVIQKDVSTIQVVLVPPPNYEVRTEDVIVKRLREEIHPGLTVSFLHAEQIPREPSGKMRLIKSEVA